MKNWFQTVKRIKRFNLVTATLRSIEWWLTRGLVCFGLLAGSPAQLPDVTAAPPVAMKGGASSHP